MKTSLIKYDYFDASRNVNILWYFLLIKHKVKIKVIFILIFRFNN